MQNSYGKYLLGAAAETIISVLLLLREQLKNTSFEDNRKAEEAVAIFMIKVLTLNERFTKSSYIFIYYK